MKPLSSRFITPWWMALLALLVLAGCGSDDNPISPTASATNQVATINSTVPDNVFSATLTGNQEVPPVNTMATGTGIVVVDLNTRQMKATIITADVNAIEAHIHQAPTGVNGPVAFPLTQSSADSGIWTTSVTLTTEQLATLRAGSLYFNVHSAAFPNGEIRGQILAQLPASGNAIPTSSTTQTGTVNPGTDTTTGTSTTTGTGTPSTVSTSSGGSGAIGTTGSGTGTSTTNGSATGTGTATGTTSGATGLNGTGAATGAAMGMSPQATTTSQTQGSQSASANRPVFFTNLLSGSLVVPATSSTASGTGLAVYRPQEKTLTAVVITTGITSASANIRQAAAGAIGPVVTSMSETGAGSGIFTARATLTDVQEQALNAGTMYYEIVSAAFPNGELRGQIVKTQGASKATNAGSAGGVTTGTTTGATTGVPTPTTSTGASTGVPTPTTSTGASTGVTTPTTSTGTSTGVPTPTTDTGTSPGVPTPTTDTGTSTGAPTPTTDTGTSTGITTPTTDTGTSTGITTPTSDTSTSTGTAPTSSVSMETAPTAATDGADVPMTTTTSTTTTVTPITTLTGSGAIPEPPSTTDGTGG